MNWLKQQAQDIWRRMCWIASPSSLYSQQLAIADKFEPIQVTIAGKMPQTESGEDDPIFVTEMLVWISVSIIIILQ